MKFWIRLLIIFSIIACKSSHVSQSPKTHAVIKKEEQRDINSLFLVYSLPVNVSHSDNFKRVEIQDSLIELLKEKKYNHLDRSAYEALFKEKQFELVSSPERMEEISQRMKNYKNYYWEMLAAADSYMQLIQLSFLKNDSRINYINVRRINLPNTKKEKSWIFTYSDSETPSQVAARILDLLINKKQTR